MAPITNIENEHTLFGFRELLAAGAVDIAQPDAGSCGGISAMRPIATLAQAASLQVIAALPVAHHSLFAQQPVLEYDRSSHPFRRELIMRPIEQVDGWVEIPNGPGLGVEVDREAVEKFSG